MEIIEHKDKNGKNDVAVIRYEIPASFRLVGLRSQKQYFDNLTEVLQVNSSEIFELTAFLGESLVADETDARTVGAWTRLLGDICQGLQEAFELAEMEYNRKLNGSAAIKISTVVRRARSNT